MILLKKASILYYKKKLILMNKQGVISLDIEKYSNLVNISYDANKIEIQCKNADIIPSIKAKKVLTLKLEEAIDNINSLVKKKLLLFGVGFRSWVHITKYKSSFLLLKIGFSRDICLKIPSDIKVIMLKPTLILIKGINNVKVNQFVALIRSLKVPDPYKGKGVQFINENLVLKAGKQN